MELFFLLWLLIKHIIVDLAIQRSTPPHIQKLKRFYCKWPWGHLHYINHCIGTFLVTWYFVNLFTAVIIAAIDYIVHWHIDYSKYRILVKFKIDNVPETYIRYWWIQTFDQILHYITYYILVILATL